MRSGRHAELRRRSRASRIPRRVSTRAARCAASRVTTPPPQPLRATGTIPGVRRTTRRGSARTIGDGAAQRAPCMPGRRARRLGPARPGAAAPAVPTASLRGSARDGRRGSRLPCRHGHRGMGAQHELVRAAAGSASQRRRISAEISADAGRPAAAVPAHRWRCASPVPASRRRRDRASAYASPQRAAATVPGERGAPAPVRARAHASAHASSPSRCSMRRRQHGWRRRDRSACPRRPTTSGSAPRFEAITGTPADIASSAGSPKPSSSDGSTRTRAPAYSARGRRAARSPELDVPGQRRLARCAASQARRPAWRGRPATSGGTARRRCEQQRIGVEQRADVLARLECADEQDVAVARDVRRAAQRLPGGAPGGQT